MYIPYWIEELRKEVVGIEQQSSAGNPNHEKCKSSENRREYRIGSDLENLEVVVLKCVCVNWKGLDEKWEEKDGKKTERGIEGEEVKRKVDDGRNPKWGMFFYGYLRSSEERKGVL